MILPSFFSTHFLMRTFVPFTYLAKISVTLCLFFMGNAFATEYKLPKEGDRLIGNLQHHVVKKGDYFQKIAEQYNIGFLALLAANPDVDPFLPKMGEKILVPSQMLLPFIKREGIVVNLPELRLYYFSPDENKVYVFPVGVGRLGLETPQTNSYIGEKRENPTWTPTSAMRERYRVEFDKELPKVVPAGPDNPFGKYALRIGTSEYLIHGSNKRFGIGMRASSGCIRMYDNDIKWLFDNVALKTKVRIIDQSVKMSYERKGLKLIEIHKPLTKVGAEQNPVNITKAIKKFVDVSNDEWPIIAPYFEQPKGVVIGIKRKG